LSWQLAKSSWQSEKGKSWQIAVGKVKKLQICKWQMILKKYLF